MGFSILAVSRRYAQQRGDGFFLPPDTEVVTHEVSSASRKRIKIPNACIGLDIKFMSPYEMLRHEQARFVLGVVP